MARSSPLSHAHPTDRLVGNSLIIQALRVQIRHLATFDTVGSAFVPTLLLQGETGTGKGLVARVIHESGPRAQGPFIEVNCAAIPETLLEVELFGFEAGTFTDARRAKPGLLESAAHGTLFLDEIDALPLSLQAKLLSALEEKRVRRLGAVADRHLDVKLIAATPAELSVRVTEGHFRPDLYYRLAVVVLEIPPLRERGADILVLAHHFLRQYAEGHGLVPKRLSGDAEGWLQRYSWPGNVRQLSHLMERVTLLRTEAIVNAPTLEQLCLPRPPLAVGSVATPTQGEAVPLDEAARIRQALSQTGGNVVRAAHLLGISRGALRYRMRRYGIGRPLFHLSASAAEDDRGWGTALGFAPILALPDQRGGDFKRPHTKADGATELWEQKPVAVLAIDVACPEAVELHVSRVEPWTQARRWQRLISEKIQGFGGLIVQHSLSPLTAVFGLPQTLEQLPQRAVQVALSIRHLVAEGERPDGGNLGPTVRMAIHLGQVLVDVQAHDLMARLLPLGETLSLPVRLLGHAVPGDILLSPQVGQLVEGWFELHGREGPAGAGLADGVGAYAVVGLGPRRSPLEVYGKRPLSRFVGRKQELTMLRELLARVDKGRGQVVGIVGEPGVGKSRLCYEFTQSQRTDHWLILESSPVAYGKETPYLPVIDLLKAYFQLDARDAVQTVRDKITRKLHMLEEGLGPILPAVLALLDVPVEDPRWQALEPPQRRQRTLGALKRLWLRASQVRPLLLVVENLHWIDTSTQAFLDSLVDGLPTARILLVVNCRPDYQHGWGSKTYYTQLRLDPLPPEHAEELLRDLLGDDIGAHGRAPLQTLKRVLIERTEGNPFFLEESLHTLVETGVLVGAPGAYQLAKPLESMQVPATVQAVLAARIDRLPSEAKRLLQTAAVIGEDVPFALLQAIAELREDTLHRGLAHLQAGEFLYEIRLFPERAFSFKHALTREVAYGSLPPERRRALHVRIMEAIEGLTRDRIGEQGERLAYHALRGEVWEKAFVYYRQAGDKAMERSAYREAVACFEHASVALRYLPEEDDTLAQGVDLLCDLQCALVALGEFEQGFDFLRQAEMLAETLGDQQRLGQTLGLMTHAFWGVGDYDHAIACGQRALALTAASGDRVHQAMVLGYLGTVYFCLGDYRRAMHLLRQALTSFEGAERQERFGIMMLPSVRVHTWLMDCLIEVGDFAEGIACGGEAVRIADAAGHLTTTIRAQHKLSDLALRQGEFPRAIPVLEHVLAQCRAAHVPLLAPGITASLALAYALSGRSAEALQLLDQVQIREEMPAAMGSSSNMHRLGEAYLQVGCLNDAFQLAERALTLACGRKERGNQAWARRLLGEIAAHRDPPEIGQAEIHYREALALAEGLGMRPLQAHCHRGFGKLCLQMGRREQACAELSAAIELYRAMDMTFWLAQAEAALTQVQ